MATIFDAAFMAKRSSRTQESLEAMKEDEGGGVVSSDFSGSVPEKMIGAVSLTGVPSKKRSTET